MTRSSRTTPVFIVVLSSIVLAISLVPLGAQRVGTANPSLVLTSLYGRDLFEFYCAPCHGHDGQGKGPAASGLKIPPADLTAISTRHGGTFPRAEISAIIAGAGRQTPEAHGSSEMPVWGPIFRGLDPRDNFTSERIANLVSYIEAFQKKGTERR
jgi:mono/diheme cytochrome c family protein